MGVLIPKELIPVETKRMRTVLLRSVLKSKNGGLSSTLFLSLILRFWFLRCKMARLCG